MAASPGTVFKRVLIFVHRWIGVALCLLFLLWFPSGIAMMYWDFPTVRPSDRLHHAPPLDVSRIRLSPTDALDRIHVADPPGQIRLASFDGRPVYRFRWGGDESIVYADSGAEQENVPIEMVRRVASAWTGQPASTAHVEQIVLKASPRRTRVRRWSSCHQSRPRSSSSCPFRANRSTWPRSDPARRG